MSGTKHAGHRIERRESAEKSAAGRRATSVQVLEDASA
jgi:hypothetical protein